MLKPFYSGDLAEQKSLLKAAQSPGIAASLRPAPSEDPGHSVSHS